jgi:hypothetical protein
MTSRRTKHRNSCVDEGKMVEDGPWTDYIDADGAIGLGGAND